MFTNKSLIKMIVPLFIDQLLLILVTFLSSLMIAQAGADALSGVSLVDMINTFLFFVFIAFASGGAVVISQYIGSKNKILAQQSAAQLISFNIVISFAISLLLFIFRDQIVITLLGKANPEVIDTAANYFSLSILSYPFYSLYQAGNAIFRSIGNTKIPMFSSILLNVLNFLGNALSIYVFHVGVFGFGLSAILSRLIASIIVFTLTLQDNDQFKVSINDVFKYHPDLLQRIVKIAIPNSIENGTLNLSKVILASLMASFGTAQIAANGVGNSIIPIGVAYGLATNLVMVTVIGQCVGANDYEAARYYIKKLMKWMYVVNTLMIVAVTALTPFIISIYHLSDEISKISFELVFLHNVFGIFLWPIAFTLPNALRSAGDSKFTMFSSIIGAIVFRVGFTLILSLNFGLGVYGVWISMIIDWAIRVILNLYRYKSNKWTQFRLV